ncbi:acriflavin resistance protein D [Plesiocystis pacifica SIR-1]|uniref:Acriflavin resistance protein D n=1 Tax=Plesiocystis pacifica SIR-1 TaxID=391625 RepID=A6GCY4_9BACT|nr:efflux RND transporter permease subunit [Plesiocystis pacifica]EDM76308.1 acriflavin resistance protein D [Plesiocystis pacifica SIR-1]
MSASEGPAQARASSEPPSGLLATLIHRPVTVTVGLVLLILAGLLSVAGLPIQLTPDITVPTVTVNTRWPGSSPAEVEAELLEEQEEALKSVVGLVRMESTARPDQAEITLEFEVGTELELALVRVSNALTEVPAYPDAADQPVVTTSSSTGPPLSIIAIRSPEGEPVAAYRTWVEDEILPQIERIPGVASIRHIGGRDTEVHVDFDVAALAARRISVAEVAARVRAELTDVSAGDLSVGKRRLLVRTPLSPDRAEDLEAVVIGAGEAGQPILLGDVAEVEVGLRKPFGVAMTNERPAMVLLLFREAGTNVLEVSSEIRAVVEALDRDTLAPEGLSIEVLSDQTGYIEGALALVRQNLIVGGVLAIVVLWLFLRSVGAAGLIGLSIPVCVFGTALGMAVLGRTVNVVSLAGTAFAVGMVVDNSIVVLESIDTWRGRVDTMAEAAWRGVGEVWGALLASTATTAAVFIPVILWQDEVGELLRDVAAAISVAVVVSLLVSVLALPSLAARLLSVREAAEDEARAQGRAPLGPRLRAAVGAQVGWLSARWTRALATLLVAMVGSAALGAWLLPPMEYLPTGNRNLVFGIITPPPGYSIDELEAIGEAFQARVAQHAGVERDGVPAISRSFFVGDPNRVFCGAAAVDDARAGELAAFYRQRQAEVPGVYAFASQASLFANRLGGGRAVEVDLSGSDLRALVGAGGALLGSIREAIPGAQVRPIPSLELGAPELHVIPRRGEVAGLGVRGSELGATVDALVDGQIIGEWGREGEPKVDVVLRGRLPDDQGTLRSSGSQAGADASTRLSAAQLAAAPVTTPSGEVVPLGSLATIEERLGPTQIRRIERSRSITLQVTPPETVALETAMATIREQVDAMQASEVIPAGVDVQLSGTAGKLEQAQGRFAQVLLLAVVISYLLLAALFEDFIAPFAVLVSVPLAGAGGVLGLLAVDRWLGLSGGDQPFDLMTALGFLILIGVVVNNAILVVDGAQARRRADPELGISEAAAQAVEARVRPIFMSALTSLAGLVPMVVASGSGSELYRGVGAVVLGGLALSTVLTLYVVPCAYTLLAQLSRRVTALRAS